MPTITTFVYDRETLETVERNQEVRFPKRRWDVDRCTKCDVLVREIDGQWVTSVEPTPVCSAGGAHYPQPSKVDVGGYYVQHAQTGVLLGWLVKHDGHWEARVTEAAFRGDGTTGSEGYVLDKVPSDLIRHRDYSLNGRPPGVDTVGYGSTREEAASELLYWLHKHQAPQVGYPAHPRVVTWEQHLVNNR